MPSDIHTRHSSANMWLSQLTEWYVSISLETHSVRIVQKSKRSQRNMEWYDFSDLYNKWLNTCGLSKHKDYFHSEIKRE